MAFSQKVAYTEKDSSRGAVRKFGVPKKHVRNWRKAKDSITQIVSKKKRLHRGGRKPQLNTDLEGQLTDWIEALRFLNVRVTKYTIQIKALEIHQ